MDDLSHRIESFGVRDGTASTAMIIARDRRGGDALIPAR